MQKKKMKLLTAAIMLSGLLASPAIAGEETFPIEVIDEYRNIEGAGYSNKQLDGSLYYVKGSSDADEKRANLSFTNNQKFSEDKYEFRNNSTTGNGTVISVEGHGKIDDIYNYTFSGNTAKGKGGVIYVNATKNGWTHINDSSFENNSASLGSVIYTNGSVDIGSLEKDVLFNNNNGYAIYIDGTDVGMGLTTTKNHKIIINDDIYINSNLRDENYTGISILGYTGNPPEAGRTGTGIIEFNGKIDIKSSNGLSGFKLSKGNNCSGGTIKLGKIPATGSYSILNEVDEFTIDLQNNHAGDTLTIPYLVTTNENSLLNFKIDFDAMTKEIDNIVVNNAGEEFLTVLNPTVKFDLANVYITADNPDWTDGTVIKYLTDNTAAKRIKDNTISGEAVLSDGVTYYFDPVGNGELKVTRVLDPKTIEECIEDEKIASYTLRSDVTLSDESKGLGTINHKKNFTINGNEYSLDGNKKDGIIVGNTSDNDQTLNIESVKGFKNFKTAVTNKGIVNIYNSTFEDNEIDLVNEKTANIESSTLNGKVQNNKGVLNLKNSTINNTVVNGAEFQTEESNKAELIVIGKDSSIKNIVGTGSVEIGNEAVLVFDKENGIQQSKVTINENGSLEIYADKLVSDNVTNNNQLTLKAQTSTETNPETNSSSKITGNGTTIIDGGIINSKELIGSKYILINENATLKGNADNIGLKDVTETIKNNGTVSLSGGTLNSKIEGGNIALTGNVTTDADNLYGDISNDGELTLTGGTIKKDIAESETGKIVIGDMLSVVNEANVNQKITVNGQYETSADKIYDKDGAITVNSSCELVLNGGTLKENRIEGTGSTMDDVPDIYIKNKVTFAFDNSKYDEKHILSNIDIDETGIFKPADNYSGDNNTVLFYDGSTIDLANGQVNTVNLKNLESNQSGDKLFILADYKDSFDSKDVSAFGDANVVIKSLDLSNMQEGDDDSYQFTNGLKDKVKMELEQVKFSDKSDKNSVYYTKADGKINIKKLSNLEEAIKEVQDNSINMCYQMKTDENLTENREITNANMSISGLGTSIKGKSLTVGDGTTERNLIISDASLKNTDLNEGDKYSLIIKDKATAKISAKDYDISIDGNINLQTDDDTTGTGSNKLTLNVDSGRTITLGEQDKENGYIVSDSATNVVTFKGQGTDSNIIANGVFDPFIANVENVTLSKNNYDDEITYNLKDGGVLNYSNDLYLFDTTKHNGTTYDKNSINFQGGTLNLANDRVNDIQLKNLVLGMRDTTLSIAKDSYINVDVDLANRKMDTLNAETVDIVDGSKLNVDMKLISDASSEITAGIKFTDNDALWSAVAVNENKEYTAESPIYRYTVKKGGTSASDGFTFTRKGGYQGYNPAMFAPAVALQGIYYTQLNNYDTAFANLDQTMLKTQAQRKAEKFANKYAYDGEETQVFSPLYSQLENKAVWFRPYVSTEKVNLKGGPKVNNTMYGALVGGDSVIMPVKDWDLQYSAYVGYNGSKQSFESNDVSQNGGVVGVTAAAYKGNLFSALTVNASIHSTDVKTKFSDNDICMLGAGIASKTGYNFEFKNGKFIIQPSWLMSYTFVNPFSDVTVQGVKVKSESLNAVQLVPGVKFIGNTETGWQPYVGLKMVFNIVDETKVKANNVKIPETTTDPYLEYGLGVQKSAGERFTGFGQAMFRGGGRNGAAFTLGGRWAVGSLKAKKN